MSSRRLDFLIRLEMLSDWSVSGGGRQGSLDSTVERDDDGLPFVPATTLRGIWRDAAEQLAYGLSDGIAPEARPNAWHELVDHLLGSQPALDDRGERGIAPIASRLALGDARLPEVLRTAIRKRTRLREALVMVKPGVGIDARSGRAKTDFLRFDEVARRGAMLEGHASIVLPDDPQSAAALVSLALASMRLVERLGGNRRRGSGRCVLTVMKVVVVDDESGKRGDGSALPRDTAAAIRWIESLGDRAPPLPPAMAAGQLSRAYARSQDDPAKTFEIIDLEVTAQTPLIVAQKVLGNVVTSLDHIPGTLLLSGIARLLQRSGRLSEDAVFAGFANGDIRVLPAYPEIAYRKSGDTVRVRGLPAPLVFERRKDDDRGPDRKGLLRNRLQETGPDYADEGQFTSVRGNYFAYEPHEAEADGKDKRTIALHLARPTLTTRTHNTVEDLRQKPTSDVGGVFTYEAIPAGMRLRTELWVRTGLVDPAALVRATDTIDLTIGRAKKAGYGAVTLRLLGPAGAAPPADPEPRDKMTLYCASDILLPSAPTLNGSSPAAVLAAAIRPLAGDDVRIVGGEVRTGRTEGWVARWGLPRSSYVLVRAGSCLVLETSTKLDAARVVREGLGARRGEGFGHVLIDPPFITRPLRHAASLGETGKKTPGGAPAHLPDISSCKDFAATIERHAVRGLIRFHAERAGADPQLRETRLRWDGGKPNMSQLGGLRAAMSGLRDAADLDRTRSLVASIAKSDSASRWGKPALDALTELLGRTDTIWQLIGLAAANGGDAAWQEALLTRSAESARGDAGLRRLAIASFLHAAMRWHKRAMEQPNEVDTALAVGER